MTGFTLSPARRDELAELLDDAPRFEAEYPGVAEYLALSPRLSGTGDEDADAAFDLRMLHYLTGGDSDNPYWDIVAPSVHTGPPQRGGRREVNGGSDSGSTRLRYAQTVLQAVYTYAIPSPHTLEWVARTCDGRRVLDIGAGRGYWAHQLDRIGVPVLAYDSEPPQRQRNMCFPATPGQPVTWHPVGDLDDLAAAPWSGSVLLLCWPPGWGDAMASQLLTEFRGAGGEQLIYIGEPPGGKTGDDAFFDLLGTGWRIADTDANFVPWWNLNDSAQHWVPR
ncbi:class I SAM-dependent methyltransferase [Nocardia wallacei]|uniref:class I SAM-dependent methyltransferase n=1 Tax=Nocardia wallacei TaxID=480035 RepID=UPI002456F81E|nr:class I SAM-dependent methyltransferase [Nocardia wallacei]